jgi:hypothetical protein
MTKLRADRCAQQSDAPAQEKGPAVDQTNFSGIGLFSGITTAASHTVTVWWLPEASRLPPVKTEGVSY